MTQAFATSSRSPLRRRVAQRLRQAREFRFRLEDEELLGLVGQEVLAEARVESGELLVDLGEARFRLGVELSARTDEVRVVEPREALLFGRPLRLVGRVVDRLDAAEQRLVLRDLIVDGGEARGHLALDRAELRPVHRRAPDAVTLATRVSVRPARSKAATVFSKVGGGVVVSDPLDLREVLGHRGFERGLEVRDLDAVERRHAAVRAFPRAATGSGGAGVEAVIACADESFVSFPAFTVVATTPHATSAASSTRTLREIILILIILCVLSDTAAEPIRQSRERAVDIFDALRGGKFRDAPQYYRDRTAVELAGAGTFEGVRARLTAARRYSATWCARRAGRRNDRRD